MQRMTYQGTCDVCGGDGVIRNTRTLVAQWTVGGFVAHTNPKICADNLARKKEIEEKEKANQKQVQ